MKTNRPLRALTRRGNVVSERTPETQRMLDEFERIINNPTNCAKCGKAVTWHGDAVRKRGKVFCLPCDTFLARLEDLSMTAHFIGQIRLSEGLIFLGMV